MAKPVHNELKKEFQLERLILFSDAVFAIAITLLVIEIKIPEIHNSDVTDKALLHELGHLVPKFFGFLISFMFIGLYWTIHHRMFGFVTSYDRKLLMLNLVFLLFIALMPFSTGFYSEYIGSDFVEKQLKVPLTFYVLNFCCLGFFNYFMWRHVTDPKNKLADPPIDIMVAKTAKARSLTVPIVFLCMLPVAYLTNVLFAVFIPMLIPVLIPVIVRITKKRISQKNKAVHPA